MRAILEERPPTVPPRGGERPPRFPLWPLRLLLFVLVMGIGSLVVAVALLPAFGAANTVLERFERQLGLGDIDVQFPRFPERSTIYAADGSVLATIFFEENRKIVRLENVSKVALQAVLAIEDARFYERSAALDVRSILRAALANIRAGEVEQGGSTITQQLVKLQFVGTEQTFARKVREAAMAIRLQREYTQDELLELYLNKVYFANGVYGIGTASQFYFGKPARSLTLTEGALLAGLIRAPEDYNPLTKPDQALARRNLVIDEMAELGWITEAEAEAARDSPLGLQPDAGVTTKREERQPVFIRYLKAQILNNEDGEFDAFGATYQQRLETLFQGGLRIHTTLMRNWQRYARQAIDGVLNLPEDPQAGLVSLETRTGAIRAMVSGRGSLRDRLDVVWQGKRQTGSAFKPFTLVAAFEQGIPPSKVYDSRSPQVIPECAWYPSNPVHNADPFAGYGFIDLWRATQFSVNVVFAQLIRDVGPENVVEVAHRMGIDSPLDPFCALTLGSEEVSVLEMTSAISTLANDGIHCEPYAVERVVSRDGVLYKHDTKSSCRQVIDPDIAHLVTAMMERVIQGGTGWRANIGRPAAGKTGTAQDYTNAWFVGYVPQITTGVWMGYARGQIPMDNVHGQRVFGGTFAAPIWHDFMIRAVEGLPVEDFPPAPPISVQTAIVPNVVGQTKADAADILIEALFTPLFKDVASVEPVGTVVGQSPAGGSRVPLGSLVTVLVSNGKPPTAWVPNVIGLSQADAEALLAERGLVASVDTREVSDPSLEGVVIDQSPPPRTRVEEGTTVRITVGAFVPPPPTPTPTPTPSPTPSPTTPPTTPPPTPPGDELP